MSKKKMSAPVFGKHWYLAESRGPIAKPQADLGSR
jgi:hypothetical protein